MKINIPKPAYRQIGGLRVSDDMFQKLEKLAVSKKVSKQELVRHILEMVIDDIE